MGGSVIRLIHNDSQFEGPSGLLNSSQGWLYSIETSVVSFFSLLKVHARTKRLEIQGITPLELLTTART